MECGIPIGLYLLLWEALRSQSWLRQSLVAKIATLVGVFVSSISSRGNSWGGVLAGVGEICISGIDAVVKMAILSKDVDASVIVGGRLFVETKLDTSLTGHFHYPTCSH